MVTDGIAIGTSSNHSHARRRLDRKLRHVYRGAESIRLRWTQPPQTWNKATKR